MLSLTRRGYVRVARAVVKLQLSPYPHMLKAAIMTSLFTLIWQMLLEKQAVRAASRFGGSGSSIKMLIPAEAAQLQCACLCSLKCSQFQIIDLKGCMRWPFMFATLMVGVTLREQSTCS